jgi:transposase
LVHRFDQQELAGLTEGERSGRPSRLEERQVRQINQVLRAKPSDAGMRVNLWDGKTLSAWIDKP